jgi:hypothetical protein
MQNSYHIDKKLYYYQSTQWFKRVHILRVPFNYCIRWGSHLGLDRALSHYRAINLLWQKIKLAEKDI